MNIPCNRRVLVVDDMASIHADFRKILADSAPAAPALADAEAELFGLAVAEQRQGFDLDSAYQGQEALAMVEAAIDAGRPYAMAFVDMRMPPGWDGVETIERLWHADEHLQVVICTAYSDHSWESVLSRLDMRDRLLILKKPFDAIEVSQLAHALTAKWQRTGELEATNRLQVRSEAEIRAVVEHLADAVLTFDAEGRIHSCNPAAQRTFGYEDGEIDGMNISALIPSLGAGTRPSTSNVLPPAGGLQGVTKQGAGISLEITTSEYELDGRKVRTAIARDIGDRLAILSDLERARRAAEQASRAKSEFISTMSHELRTPMNGVIGSVSVLERSPLSAQQRALLAAIGSSAGALMEIVDDILDFSDIDAGRVTLDRQPLSVADLAAKVRAMVAATAASKDVELSVQVDPSLPAVWGDAMRMQQVLVRLLDNAIKFSGGQVPWPKVCVQVRALVGEAGKRLLEFAVEDNGIGMDAPTRSRLFTPFLQGDGKATRRFGGTGLGLAICQRLVVLQGGTIEAGSAVGVGSTFTVRFPLDEAPPLTGGPAPHQSPLAKRAEGRAGESDGASLVTPAGVVLLAEDNPINQRVILAQLELLGFQAELAGDGRKALDRLRDGGIALLLTDLRMPELDGFELAIRLRQEPGDLGRIPIIALTANAQKGESDRCLAVGMNAYLTKPVSLPALEHALRSWMRCGASATPVPPAALRSRPLVGALQSAEPVDPDVLPALVGTDPNVLSEFFSDFAQSSGQAEEALRRAFDQGLEEEVVSAAHRLKGSARSIGAIRLGDRCAELEAAGRDADSAVLAASLPQVLTEAAAVREWIKERHGPAASVSSRSA